MPKLWHTMARNKYRKIQAGDMELYIGLMSGTSVDGIDAVLVDFTLSSAMIVATHYYPYPQALRKKIHDLCIPGDNEIERLGELDVILGKEFAKAVNTLLKNHGIESHCIKAIGSHGQTIRHYPKREHCFTLQIGDPNIIASETGITTIADFRRKDMAHGGQGAPLVPAFHQKIFSSPEVNRVIVNIGGIANITLLPKDSSESIIGFDTGPGNTLLDAWIQLHQKELHDKNGEWSAQGKVQPALLKQMLEDAYFQLSPPKSTGKEYFNLAWLQNHLHTFKKEISSVDVQTTLVELTAQSIIDAIKNYFSCGEILICGGGAHNTFLISRLCELALPFNVSSTQKHAIHPDWVEATAFAWLAKQTINQQTGNLPSVTGAKKAAILGGLYYGN